MSDRFQILAIDGGGIKGLFSAAVLAKLEEDLSIKVADHFDLIAGTSTGGIIALGLGLGMRPAAIVDFYITHGPKIFHDTTWKRARQYFTCKHDPEPLEKALKLCFGEKKLGESTKRLVIPSYNLDADAVYVKKTAHHERLRSDYKLEVWKVAMATTAAPTFFPAFKGIDGIRAIDGGVWANNPSMVTVIEAVSLLGQQLENIHLLNVGTTDEVKNRSDKLTGGGFWHWKEAGVDVALTGQSISAYNSAWLMLGKGRAFRVEAKVPEGLFGLDKLNLERLNSHASHIAREFSPVFVERYLEHKAPPFKPYHGLEEPK